MKGDPNGSISTTEPIISRPMYGAMPSSLKKTCMLFVSQVSVDNGTIDSYNLKKRVEPVKNCRNISKHDMKLNSAMPALVVDPETYTVTADGVECVCDPVEALPLTQSTFLF